MSRQRSTIVAVIPARYGSTRFPGKALAMIKGRPMIQWVYERTAKAASLDRVLVATDDQRIADAVLAFGGECVMTSSAHSTGTDRIAEVAASLDCDLIVNVQGDEPLIEPAMIDDAVAPLRHDPGIVMGTLCGRIDIAEEAFDPNIVKVVLDRDGFALYFSRAPIPWDRDRWSGLDVGARPLHDRFYKHIGLYVYRRAFLLNYAALGPTPLESIEKLEQLRALETGHRIKVVETSHRSIGVDTPHDLQKILDRV